VRERERERRERVPKGRYASAPVLNFHLIIVMTPCVSLRLFLCLALSPCLCLCLCLCMCMCPCPCLRWAGPLVFCSLCVVCPVCAQVLDMCAAPGSKTAQLVEMLHRDQEPGALPPSKSSPTRADRSAGWIGWLASIVILCIAYDSPAQTEGRGNGFHTHTHACVLCRLTMRRLAAAKRGVPPSESLAPTDLSTGGLPT